MKNLILIRHAKSSWESPVRDIDRTLEHKGIHDAHLVAANCMRFIPSTYIIWSSSAKRTQETAMIFCQNFSYPIESVVFKEELYTFEVKQLETVIKSCSNDFENVILFGHNDAITNFVDKFGDVFIGHVPTAGLVWLQFDTDSWGKINKGKTKKTIFPKNLK